MAARNAGAGRWLVFQFGTSDRGDGMPLVRDKEEIPNVTAGPVRQDSPSPSAPVAITPAYPAAAELPTQLGPKGLRLDGGDSLDHLWRRRAAVLRGARKSRRREGFASLHRTRRSERGRSFGFGVPLGPPA
jgi:hypothetical protein